MQIQLDVAKQREDRIKESYRQLLNLIKNCQQSGGSVNKLMLDSLHNNVVDNMEIPSTARLLASQLSPKTELNKRIEGLLSVKQGKVEPIRPFQSDSRSTIVGDAFQYGNVMKDISGKMMNDRSSISRATDRIAFSDKKGMPAPDPNHRNETKENTNPIYARNSYTGGKDGKKNLSSTSVIQTIYNAPTSSNKHQKKASLNETINSVGELMRKKFGALKGGKKISSNYDDSYWKGKSFLQNDNNSSFIRLKNHYSKIKERRKELEVNSEDFKMNFKKSIREVKNKQAYKKNEGHSFYGKSDGLIKAPVNKTKRDTQSILRDGIESVKSHKSSSQKQYDAFNNRSNSMFQGNHGSLFELDDTSGDFTSKRRRDKPFAESSFYLGHKRRPSDLKSRNHLISAYSLLPGSTQLIEHPNSLNFRNFSFAAKGSQVHNADRLSDNCRLSDKKTTKEIKDYISKRLEKERDLSITAKESEIMDGSSFTRNLLTEGRANICIKVQGVQDGSRIKLDSSDPNNVNIIFEGRQENEHEIKCRDNPTFEDSCDRRTPKSLFFRPFGYRRASDMASKGRRSSCCCSTKRRTSQGAKTDISTNLIEYENIANAQFEINKQFRKLESSLNRSNLGEN